MRTSNKILLLAMLLFAATLVFYDLGLKSEYDKGAYKQAFWDYQPLILADFNAIKLNSSTALNVLVVQGPFKVLAAPSAMSFLKIECKNKTLVIDASFANHYFSIFNDYALYISCPNLSQFSSTATYAVRHSKITDTVAKEFSWKPSLITGFNQDSLHIEEDFASNLVLEKNKIGVLVADVGLSPMSGARLTIGTGNSFNNTQLNIENKSALWIHSADENRYNYQLADNSQLVLDGIAAKKLLKSTKP